MVRAAERSGELQPGATIVESTSGNTGIGLALIGRLTGHPVVVVTGDTISQEKLAALHSYGARVVLTDWSAPSESPENARAVAARITAETPGAWRPMQFDNPANPAAHYQTTGPEIWEQTHGLVTHFVAGIGTGGTIKWQWPLPEREGCGLAAGRAPCGRRPRRLRLQRWASRGDTGGRCG